MEKRTIKEKNIVDPTKDKITITFYPQKGVTAHVGKEDKEFLLGEDIDKYKSFRYDFDPKLISSSGEALDFDSYILKDYPISLWADDKSGKDLVHVIDCEETCLWQDKELIGMMYDDFLSIFNLIPDYIDSQWMSGPFINGRNYNIYGFGSLGINLWVWRKRIRQALIYSPYDEEDE